MYIGCNSMFSSINTGVTRQFLYIPVNKAAIAIQFALFLIRYITIDIQ